MRIYLEESVKAVSLILNPIFPQQKTGRKKNKQTN